MLGLNVLKLISKEMKVFARTTGFSIPNCYVVRKKKKKKIREKCREWHNHKKGKRKVQGVPQLQTATLSKPQEEEETDKSKQAQIEQTYEKH